MGTSSCSPPPAHTMSDAASGVHSFCMTSGKEEENCTLPWLRERASERVGEGAGCFATPPRALRSGTSRIGRPCRIRWDSTRAKLQKNAIRSVLSVLCLSLSLSGTVSLHGRLLRVILCGKLQCEMCSSEQRTRFERQFVSSKSGCCTLHSSRWHSFGSASAFMPKRGEEHIPW